MEIKLLTYKNINELITGRPLDDITVGRVTCYLWGVNIRGIWKISLPVHLKVIEPKQSQAQYAPNYNTF